MKIIIILSALVMPFSYNCKAQVTGHSTRDSADNSIFQKGDRAPAGNFTGTVWVKPLVADDTTFNCTVGNVIFEAGARSNWHIHPAGQILLITAGMGYYQEKGKPIRVIKKGDIVKCPPNAEHWHGASPDSMMTHISVISNTEKGVVIWMQKVTDQEYKNLK